VGTGVREVEVERSVEGEVKGVSVGDTRREERVVDVPRVEEVAIVFAGGKKSSNDLKGSTVYVPKYASIVDDLEWATKCVIVSVVNGEAILVLQRRISDAGFDSLLIIPLGADKVLLRSPDGRDVNSILSEAPIFFNIFFSNPTRWNKDLVVQERGAWIIIYGVPIHAWNYDFFKLCVLDCGRLLRVDDLTMGKEWLDYARVLVSTCSLEVLNLNTSVMINGVLFKLKIIEEWGFSLGEDACIPDEDVNSVEENSGLGVHHDNIGDDGDVNDLIQQLSDDWNNEVQKKHVTSRPTEDQCAVHGNKETEFIDLFTADFSPSVSTLPKEVQLPVTVSVP